MNSFISRINVTRLLIIIFFLLIIFTNNIQANSFEVTEQNIRDAILSRVNFNDDQLIKMDLNGDNKVDAADLIKYFKLNGNDLPIVNFKTTTSSVAEHIENTTVEIHFDRDFYGTIKILTSGTATEQKDYRIVTKKLDVNGKSAALQINIIDDFELENLETIVFDIEIMENSSQKFYLGMPHKHTLIIQENDNVWNGSLEVKNLSIGFDMEILRNKDLYEAILKSDGGNCIPQGQWPVNIDIKDNFLKLYINSIVINKDSTLLDATLKRNIILESNPKSNDSHIFEIDSMITGKMRDQFESTDRQYMNTNIEGTFTLVRNPQVLSSK